MTQISIFDNMALGEAEQCLPRLKLEKAIAHFEEALGFPNADQASIRAAIADCRFWSAKLPKHNKPELVPVFLKAYREHRFSTYSTGLMKGLLRLAAEKLCEMEEPESETLATVFDLLLKLKMYQKAEGTLNYFVQQFPKKHNLLYYLAQVQWLNGNKHDAKKNYARALLYCPKKLFSDRIECPELKKITQAHGMAMAPAYGKLYGVLPFAEVENEIKPFDNGHQRAIETYGVLNKIHIAASKKEEISLLKHRTKLQALAPNFYQNYFKLLQNKTAGQAKSNASN